MSGDQVGTSSAQKRCFVVMGFGVKTDFATGRKLDLNKSYRALIKPVVEQKGLLCIRADEIRHSGAIDVPMYQELLGADVVIADLSTANPNALYELGIRHALRPRTTIVISESKLPYPFDLNHIAITSYTHLGDVIDYDEVIRFQKVLGDTLEAVLRGEMVDSPVYTYLTNLDPPALRQRAQQAATRAGEALAEVGKAISQATAAPSAKPDQAEQTLAMLTTQAEEALAKDRFIEAKGLFGAALQICKNKPNAGAVAHDPYLIQRLTLATYKSKQPDQVSALNEALGVLYELDPETSNDPETVGLFGAIHKRLFDAGQGQEHLDVAIRCYGRGYLLRDDWYNGINLAYLLNVRTDTPLDARKEDQIADLVWANRIRREVLTLCDKNIDEIAIRERRPSGDAGVLQQDQEARDRDQKFWCLATKSEAHLGLGELDNFAKSRKQALALDPADWMVESFDQQIQRLKGLLEKHRDLLAPPQQMQAP